MVLFSSVCLLRNGWCSLWASELPLSSLGWGGKGLSSSGDRRTWSLQMEVRSTRSMETGKSAAKGPSLTSISWESTTFIQVLLHCLDNTSEFLGWWYVFLFLLWQLHKTIFLNPVFFFFFLNNELEFCSVELSLFLCCSLWWVWWEHLSPPAAFMWPAAEQLVRHHLAAPNFHQL